MALRPSHTHTHTTPLLTGEGHGMMAWDHRRLTCSVGLVDHGLHDAPASVDEPVGEEERQESEGGSSRLRRTRVGVTRVSEQSKGSQASCEGR